MPLTVWKIGSQSSALEQTLYKTTSHASVHTRNVDHSIFYIQSFYYKAYLLFRSSFLFSELLHDGMMCNTAGSDIVFAFFSAINKRHSVTWMSHHFYFLSCSTTTPNKTLIIFQAHSKWKRFQFNAYMLSKFCTDTFMPLLTRSTVQYTVC